MNPLGHRKQHRHLDAREGGKGYAYCSCCLARIEMTGGKSVPEPVRSCDCHRQITACVSCGRCPLHGRCDKRCVQAPNSGAIETPMTRLISAMITKKI